MTVHHLVNNRHRALRTEKGGLIVSGPGVSVGHRILSPAKVPFE